jgi:hypothetical protein
MFALLELILSSPIGVFLFGSLQNTLYALVIAADCDDCGFNDPGTMFLGGVITAVFVGLGTFILLRRLKEKTSAASGFVSIMANDRRR